MRVKNIKQERNRNIPVSNGMKKVVVCDKMQDGYTYTCTEPEGKNFNQDFKPMLTPKEMLELGIFNGVYMRDCTDEFPRSWFKNAKFATDKPDPKLNHFEVRASQPLRVWREKGWIHKDDPRGWFQWYCRYYMGRRHEDDERQVKRWKAFARHAGLLHWAYDSRKI